MNNKGIESSTIHLSLTFFFLYTFSDSLVVKEEDKTEAPVTKENVSSSAQTHTQSPSEHAPSTCSQALSTETSSSLPTSPTSEPVRTYFVLLITLYCLVTSAYNSPNSACFVILLFFCFFFKLWFPVLSPGSKKAQLCRGVPEAGQRTAASTIALSLHSHLFRQPTPARAQGKQGGGASSQWPTNCRETWR